MASPTLSYAVDLSHTIFSSPSIYDERCSIPVGTTDKEITVRRDQAWRVTLAKKFLALPARCQGLDDIAFNMSSEALSLFCKEILDAGTTFEAVAKAAKELSKDIDADWRTNPSIIPVKVSGKGAKNTLDLLEYAKVQLGEPSEEERETTPSNAPSPSSASSSSPSPQKRKAATPEEGPSKKKAKPSETEKPQATPLTTEARSSKQPKIFAIGYICEDTLKALGIDETIHYLLEWIGLSKLQTLRRGTSMSVVSEFFSELKVSKNFPLPFKAGGVHRKLTLKELADIMGCHSEGQFHLKPKYTNAIANDYWLRLSGKELLTHVGSNTSVTSI